MPAHIFSLLFYLFLQHARERVYGDEKKRKKSKKDEDSTTDGNSINPLLHRLFLDHDVIFYFQTTLKKN